MNRRTLAFSLGIIFCWIILLFGISKFSNNFIQNRTSYELPPNLQVVRRSLVLPFLNYDGRNFLQIANSGYIKLDEHNLRAFFPLYPLVIAYASKLTGINVVYSGLFLSYVAAIGSFYIFYRLTKEESDEKTSLKAVFLLMVFPTSFYFLSYYTESLYLLLSLLVFWFLIKKNFKWSTFFALLASATRVTGVILSLMVVLEGYRYFLKKRKFPFITLLSPLGLVGYAMYSYLTAGDALIFLHSWTNWGKTFSIPGPINSVLSGLGNVFAGVQPSFDSPFVYPISILEFLTLIFLLAVLYWSYKRIKLIYWLYLLINSYVFLAGGILQSLPRYILVMFPMYVYLAKVLKGKRFILYSVVSAILLILLSAIFLRGYWVA